MEYKVISHHFYHCASEASSSDDKIVMIETNKKIEDELNIFNKKVSGELKGYKINQNANISCVKNNDCMIYTIFQQLLKNER